MPGFGERSQTKLETVHADNQLILVTSITYGPDFSIIWGFRGEADQNKAFEEGNSNKEWDDSKHNIWPSEAFDVAPWPILYGDKAVKGSVAASERLFRILGPYILGVADTLLQAGRISAGLIWGGDWDRDYDTTDQELMDLGHFERRTYGV